MKTYALLLAAMVGCSGPMESGERLVAPFDGEDAVPVDAPLRLIGYARTLAPDTVPPDLLQVVSLGEGGFVKGDMSRDGDDLVFTPDGGWTSGSAYHWHINESGSPPRSVAWGLGSDSAGDLSFTSREGARPIELVRTDTGLCVVYSARLDGAPMLELTVDGDPVAAKWLVVDEEEVSPLSRTPKRTLSFACTAGSIGLGEVAVTTMEGEVLRNVGLDDRIEDVVVRRRRGVLR
jgi:hypothetical protein